MEYILAPFENSIYTVSIGERVYLSFESVIVTEIGTFIHVFSEVIVPNEKNKNDKTLIEITRLGLGFTEENWKFDCERARKYCLCIESEGQAQNYLDRYDQYIYFPNYQNKRSLLPTVPTLDIAELERQLQESLKSQSYEQAAQIRDEIEKYNKTPR